jgi:hypothetical protein
MWLSLPAPTGSTEAVGSLSWSRIYNLRWKIALMQIKIDKNLSHFVGEV